TRGRRGSVSFQLTTKPGSKRLISRGRHKGRVSGGLGGNKPAAETGVAWLVAAVLLWGRIEPLRSTPMAQEASRPEAASAIPPGCASSCLEAIPPDGEDCSG